MRAQRSSTTRRLAVLVAGLTVATAWFVWLRPASLGGRVSYVVVQGSSMSPTYDDGDLVVVRKDAGYGQGDVIAFRAGGTFDSPTRIIHRIVGETDDGSFVTQGDNRDRVDPWRPEPEQVIGRAILHVPMVGDAVGFVTRPEALAALGGAAVVVGGRRRRRRRRMSSPPDDRRVEVPELPRPARPKARAPRWTRFTQPRWAFAGLVASVLIAVPVLALTWSALRAPDTTTSVDRLGTAEFGVEVDYRFTGEPSPVYPTGVVTAVRNPAGVLTPTDPLYSRLLDRLELSVAFRVSDEGADRVTSSYALDVSLTVPSGWSTTVASVPATPFEDTARESVGVDLRAVAEQVAGVAALTGVGGDTYTLTAGPVLEVEVEGEGGGQAVSEKLAPPVQFVFENNVIVAQATASDNGTLELTREVREPHRYAVGPIDLDTQTARGVLSGLALVLVAGAVWFASVMFGGFGLGEPERISARYRSQIVDVASASAPPGPVVLVSGIDELAHIAKLEQTVILHEALPDGAHRYRVFLGTVTYEYVTAPEHAGGAVAAEVADQATERSTDADWPGS